MPANEPYEPLLPDGMHVPAQVLRQERLTGVHDWTLLPSGTLRFREDVEMVMGPRPDIKRYQIIAETNRTIARNLFSIFARSNTLFRILVSISCSRTYARDAEEAYYVDAMDTYLNSPPSELDITDIPLLKSSLRNRMFNAFNRKPGYRSELFERRRLKRWMPFDSPDSRHFDDATLGTTYPKTEPWVDEIYQPPALAIPLPFAVYYYHQELRDAETSGYVENPERLRRLLFCVRMEYYLFFLAMWWNEVVYGGRMYVLEESAINKLEAECSTVQDVGGKPAQAIFAHMRMVAAFRFVHHNWMTFTDDCMESSTFVWGIKGSGGLDVRRPARLRYFCSKAERKVSTSKYGCALMRRSSVMDERLSIPDLDKIEGLLGLVEEHQWQAHGSLRVCDLVHHLLHLYRNRHALVQDMQGDMGESNRELQHKIRALDHARMDLEDARKGLDDTKERLRYRDERLDYLESMLRQKEKREYDLQQFIDNQSRQLQHFRSKQALSSGEGNREGQNRPEAGPPSPHYTPRHTPTMQPEHCEVPRGQVSEPRSPQYNPRTDSTVPRSGTRIAVFPATIAEPSTPANQVDPSPSGTPKPAQAASPYRPKRGYPFYSLPSPARKRLNSGSASNSAGQAGSLGTRKEHPSDVADPTSNREGEPSSGNRDVGKK